jgi:hypothetical protein
MEEGQFLFLCFALLCFALLCFALLCFALSVPVSQNQCVAWLLLYLLDICDTVPLRCLFVVYPPLDKRYEANQISPTKCINVSILSIKKNRFTKYRSSVCQPKKQKSHLINSHKYDFESQTSRLDRKNVM